MLVKVKVWMCARAHDAHVTCRYLAYLSRLGLQNVSDHQKPMLCPSDTFVPARSSCTDGKDTCPNFDDKKSDTRAQPCSKHHWYVRFRICSLKASTTTLGVSRYTWEQVRETTNISIQLVYRLSCDMTLAT